MNTSLVNLILFIFQELVKIVPGMATEFAKLFSKGEPTQADWEAFRARVLAKKYEDYDKTFAADSQK